MFLPISIYVKLRHKDVKTSCYPYARAKINSSSIERFPQLFKVPIVISGNLLIGSHYARSRVTLVINGDLPRDFLSGLNYEVLLEFGGNVCAIHDLEIYADLLQGIEYYLHFWGGQVFKAFYEENLLDLPATADKACQRLLHFSVVPEVGSRKRTCREKCHSAVRLQHLPEVEAEVGRVIHLYFVLFHSCLEKI